MKISDTATPVTSGKKKDHLPTIAALEEFIGICKKFQADAGNADIDYVAGLSDDASFLRLAGARQQAAMG